MADSNVPSSAQQDEGPTVRVTKSQESKEDSPGDGSGEGNSSSSRTRGRTRSFEKFELPFIDTSCKAHTESKDGNGDGVVESREILIADDDSGNQAAVYKSNLKVEVVSSPVKKS